MSIKQLLELQYDAVKQQYIITQDEVAADLKLLAINHLLTVSNLQLLVCNGNDHTQNVLINKDTLEYYVSVQSNKFSKFNPNMCDYIYTQMENRNLDHITIKLKSGDILTCDLEWEQGHGNNYYFSSNYFNARISIDEVIEYKL